LKIREHKILIITILTIVYSIVIGLIVISFLAKDEGTLGNGVILNFLADYLWVLAFPTILLISALANTGLSNIQFISLGILLSGFIYAVITNLLYSYFQTKK
jgi:hypothetical protein